MRLLTATRTWYHVWFARRHRRLAGQHLDKASIHANTAIRLSAQRWAESARQEIEDGKATDGYAIRKSQQDRVRL